MAARRVLIVEDHPPTRRLLEEALSAAGVGTDAVDNGAQALTFMGSQRPDLVITDFIMPHLNGMELAHAMHKAPLLAEIPVVFLTAVDTPELRRESAKVGVKRFLTKPIDRSQVVAMVNEILARSTAD